MNSSTFVRYFSNIGFYSWILQRVSAIIIFIFFVITCCYIMSNKSLEFNFFLSLFLDNRYNTYLELTLVFVFFNVLLHTWIGIWIVFTDYIKNIFLRFCLQILINLIFFLYFLLLLNSLH